MTNRFIFRSDEELTPALKTFYGRKFTSINLADKKTKLSSDTPLRRSTTVLFRNIPPWKVYRSIFDGPVVFRKVFISHFVALEPLEAWCFSQIFIDGFRVKIFGSLKRSLFFKSLKFVLFVVFYCGSLYLQFDRSNVFS